MNGYCCCELLTHPLRFHIALCLSETSRSHFETFSAYGLSVLFLANHLKAMGRQSPTKAAKQWHAS